MRAAAPDRLLLSTGRRFSSGAFFSCRTLSRARSKPRTPDRCTAQHFFAEGSRECLLVRLCVRHCLAAYIRILFCRCTVLFLCFCRRGRFMEQFYGCREIGQVKLTIKLENVGVSFRAFNLVEN